MSDWLAGAAHQATPSGGAIVDHTKDGARQGRGRGQARGVDRGWGRVVACAPNTPCSWSHPFFLLQLRFRSVYRLLGWGLGGEV